MKEDRAQDSHIDQEDLAPGSAKDDDRFPKLAIANYLAGLLLSLFLTAASFFFLDTQIVWAPAIPTVLVVLAIGQIGVHLVFFLHITTDPDNTNNILALAFGILIVGLIVVGSVWIMAHLNHNMIPMARMMEMQR